MPDKLWSDEEEELVYRVTLNTKSLYIKQQEQLWMITGKKSLQWYKQKLHLTLN